MFKFEFEKFANYGMFECGKFEI